LLEQAVLSLAPAQASQSKQEIDYQIDFTCNL